MKRLLKKEGLYLQQNKGVQILRDIKILDCTLRDGGCVNNFEFGNQYMKDILDGIEKSGVEIIELGYIDEKAGSHKERTQFINERVIPENYNLEKKPNVTYVAMVDYGKYNPDNLQPKSDMGIDGIRLAFHKKDRKNIIEWGRKILDKGYQLFIQPMTCLRYSDAEMLDLINDVNTYLPEATAFYIVDSFGEMRLNDLNRIANLVDHNLSKQIAMGLHSHNNLQLSYSNAVTLLNYRTKRNIIFDASIMGMGKGAGNMNTELFAEHLKIYADKEYEITPLLDVIDKVINQIRENFSWGYSVEYYLSAANHCTPSYAGHFYKKHMLSVSQVAELLGLIDEEKKISFDKNYAEELYYNYNAKTYNDDISIKLLSENLIEKDVLILAPGKSVGSHIEKIKAYAQNENTVVIALNVCPPFETDYIFASKENVLNEINCNTQKVIVTSNLKTEKGIKINYATWTKWSGGNSDSALIIMLNVLKFVGVKKIALAGCDGFEPDVDCNYFDEKLKRPVTKEQAERRNARAKQFLNDIKDDMEIVFLTPSKYE